MPSPLIKICGITRVEDAAAATALGVGALGFNFYQKSSRYITPERAREIIKQLPKDVWKVALVVNSSTEEIAQLVRDTAVDTLQLHGDEMPEQAAIFRDLRIIRAVRISATLDPEVLEKWRNVCDYFLFDAWQQDKYGGTGQELPDDFLGRLTEKGRRLLLSKSFIAGGISSHNIAKKTQLFQPFGFDVASGVEDSPGIKSQEKIKELMEKLG